MTFRQLPDKTFFRLEFVFGSHMDNINHLLLNYSDHAEVVVEMEITVSVEVKVVAVGVKVVAVGVVLVVVVTAVVLF